MSNKFGTGRFCSRACANSRQHSEETKQKIKTSVVNYCKSVKHTELKYLQSPKLCKCCGKIIPYALHRRKCCSDKCAETLKIIGSHCGGKKAAEINSNSKRSKNEIYFYQLCLNFFKDVKHNEAIFNGWDADVIIEDIKYAILWNGPWHYKKITLKHSVEQVQNRDRLKIKEIYAKGYTPYIIRDDGKYNKTFVEQQFDIFINSLKNLEK